MRLATSWGWTNVAALGLGDKLAGEEFQDGAVEAGLGQVLEEGLIGIATGLLRVELVGEEDNFAQGVQGRVGEGVPADGGVDAWIVEAVILPEEFGANGTVEEDGRLLVDEADGDLEALGLGEKLGVGQVAGDVVGQGGEGGALGIDAVAGGQVFGDGSNPLDVGPEARGELGNAGCDALFRSFHLGAALDVGWCEARVGVNPGLPACGRRGGACGGERFPGRRRRPD